MLKVEEEFMLSLVRLYKAANPTMPGNQYEAAVKRKYLQGILPDLEGTFSCFVITHMIKLQHVKNL